MKTLSVCGRLGNEPEVKNANGTSILSASVACDYQKKTRDGGYEKATQWVRVVVFGKRAESLAKVLQKGMRVAASGDMRIDEYTDKQGQHRVSVEVNASDIEPLFDKKDGGGERRGGAHEPAGGSDDFDMF